MGWGQSDLIQRLKEEQDERARRERRERIATAALNALIITCNTSNRCADPDTYVVTTAVKLADKLIRELDKPPRKKKAKPEGDK